MTTEQISSISEVISYFLVTPAIFGKERLEQLGKQLENKIDALMAYDFEAFFKRVQHALIEKITLSYYTLFLFLISLSALLFILVALHLLPEVENHFVIKYFLKEISLYSKSPVIRAFLTILYLVAWIPIAYFLVRFSISILIFILRLFVNIISLLEYGLDKLLSAFLKYIYKKKLEGVMLVVGTIIFLYSKILLFLVS